MSITQEIINKCREIIDKKCVSKNKFQSLIGSLMYIHKCIRSSRMFTNRLLENLRNAKGRFISINEEIIRDVKWFLEFIPKFNGSATYVHEPPFKAHTIEIDASLHRVGGVWGNQVYTVKIPDFVKCDASITHFEMINILVALQVWKQAWTHKYIEFYVDNQAVVSICNTGYTRDSILATYMRNIWLLTSVYDIRIAVKHIAGKKNNIADLLSRWEDNSPSHISKLSQLVQYKWQKVSDEFFKVNVNI